MKINTTRQTLEHLERVIQKNCKGAIIAELRRNVYVVGDYPNELPQTLIDYINCHFEVIESNKQTMTFRYESNNKTHPSNQ